MTAASAARYAPRMGEHVDPVNLSLPIADNVCIYCGTLVGLDASGYVRPMGALSSTARCLGVAEATVDNTTTGHTAGRYNVPIRQGTFRLENDSAPDAVASTHVGSPCYAVDDQTVSASTNGGTRAIAGVVEKVETAGVYVRVGGFAEAELRTDLANTANAKGAALVGIEDALALIGGATVEAALAELAKYQAINLADPGTAAAIPVTRSAYVGLTIAAGQAETNTLAIPTYTGCRLVLNADTVGAGGTRAVTASQAINQAGNTVMTFAAARDMIVLEAIKVGGAFRWQVIANDGVALS